MKKKSTTLKLSLPKDVIDRFEKVARMVGITRNQAILVVALLEALKVDGGNDDNREANVSSSNRGPKPAKVSSSGKSKAGRNSVSKGKR